jgi:hypothetical protein
MAPPFGEKLHELIDQGHEIDRGFVHIKPLVLEMIHDDAPVGRECPKEYRHEQASSCVAPEKVDKHDREPERGQGHDHGIGHELGLGPGTGAPRPSFAS